MVQHLRGAFFFSYYLIDKQSFIENFCQNKDLPQLDCEGKCKLTDLSKENETFPNFDFGQFTSDFVWIFHQFEKFSIIPLKKWTKNLFLYKNLYTENILFSIFRPPIL